VNRQKQGCQEEDKTDGPGAIFGSLILEPEAINCPERECVVTEEKDRRAFQKIVIPHQAGQDGKRRAASI